jgi:hypothetical protein
MEGRFDCFDGLVKVPGRLARRISSCQRRCAPTICVVARRINFEDDTFFLSLRLRCIEQANHLDLDAQPYVQSLVDDLRLIDGCIRALYTALAEALQLLRRTEHLLRLAELALQLGDLLQALPETENAISHAFPAESVELARRGELQHTLAAAMRESASTRDEPAADEHQVSAEEMQHLLLDEAEGV